MNTSMKQTFVGNIANQKYEASQNIQRHIEVVQFTPATRETSRWREESRIHLLQKQRAREVALESKINLHNQHLNNRLYEIVSEKRQERTKVYIPGWRIGRAGTCMDCYPSEAHMFMKQSLERTLEQKHLLDELMLQKENQYVHEFVTSAKSSYQRDSLKKSYEKNREMYRVFQSRTPHTTLHLGLVKTAKEIIKKRNKLAQQTSTKLRPSSAPAVKSKHRQKLDSAKQFDELLDYDEYKKYVREAFNPNHEWDPSTNDNIIDSDHNLFENRAKSAYYRPPSVAKVSYLNDRGPNVLEVKASLDTAIKAASPKRSYVGWRPSSASNANYHQDPSSYHQHQVAPNAYTDNSNPDDSPSNMAQCNVADQLTTLSTQNNEPFSTVTFSKRQSSLDSSDSLKNILSSDDLRNSFKAGEQSSIEIAVQAAVAAVIVDGDSSKQKSSGRRSTDSSIKASRRSSLQQSDSQSNSRKGSIVNRKVSFDSVSRDVLNINKLKRRGSSLRRKQSQSSITDLETMDPSMMSSPSDAEVTTNTSDNPVPTSNEDDLVDLTTGFDSLGLADATDFYQSLDDINIVSRFGFYIRKDSMPLLSKPFFINIETPDQPVQAEVALALFDVGYVLAGDEEKATFESTPTKPSAENNKALSQISLLKRSSTANLLNYTKSSMEASQLKLVLPTSVGLIVAVHVIQSSDDFVEEGLKGLQFIPLKELLNSSILKRHDSAMAIIREMQTFSYLFTGVKGKKVAYSEGQSSDYWDEIIIDKDIEKPVVYPCMLDMIDSEGIEALASAIKESLAIFIDESQTLLIKCL